MAAGETKTFTAPLAGGDHEGDDAECTVTVQSVKVRELPALDDDFAQLASEFDTLEELRADVIKQAEQAKKYEQGIQARDKVLEHLLETVDVPVPDGVVEAEVNQHLEGENRLDDDEHRAEVDESTRKALRAQFLLDAIAEKLEVRVEQPELIEYLVMSAQQYGMDPNEFAQTHRPAGPDPLDRARRSPAARRSPPCSTRRRSPTPPAPRSTSTSSSRSPRRPRPTTTTTSTSPPTRSPSRRPTTDARAPPPHRGRRGQGLTQPAPPARTRTGTRRAAGSRVSGRGWTRGAQGPAGAGGDDVVPTRSRTGNGSSAIGRPSRARRTSRPMRRPFSAPGCSTVVSTWSSHGRSTPSKPVT